MSFDLVELDFAVGALAQSLDLVSRGRERVLDRDLDVHVAWVIGIWGLTTMFSWGGIVTQMFIR